MHKPRILAFSGSARLKSFNQRLVEYAATLAQYAGAEVTVINLRDFPMPLMNQDLERESGVPAEALRLKKLLIEHDGILLSAPEYNTSITPLLKNSLDWVSRRVGDEAPMVAYRGKTAALMSASPGRFGGARGLPTVRRVLASMGVLVLPEQVSVTSAADAFDDEGKLVGDFYPKSVRELVEHLVDTLRRLAPN
jgi:NAD(P)H-dependent FMN reductase